MTQFEALKKAGWVQPVDYVLGTVSFIGFLVSIGSLAIWMFNGSNSWLTSAAVFFIVESISFHAWIAILMFRCSSFVLQVRADINLMPAEAARLALAFQRGSAPVNE
jgi:hypothetical protein